MPIPIDAPSAIATANDADNEESIGIAVQSDVKTPMSIQAQKKRTLGTLIRKIDPTIADIIIADGYVSCKQRASKLPLGKPSLIFVIISRPMKYHAIVLNKRAKAAICLGR